MTDSACRGATKCGKPTAWRAGCRGPACRRAHNEETNRYRGLRGEQLATVKRALQAGQTPEEAASVAGVRMGQITQRAQRDPELAQLLALRGRYTLPLRARAQQASYLAALLIEGGNPDAAAIAAAVPAQRLATWRQDPLFASAAAAVAALATGAGPAQPALATEEKESFLRALRSTGDPAKAAASLGVPLEVYEAVRRSDPAWAARWYATLYPRGKAPRWRGGYQSRTRDDLPEIDTGLLTQLWADPDLTVRDIAACLDTDTVQVWRAAESILLPRKNGSASEDDKDDEDDEALLP
ncbi:hypothetical protein [Actinacidiphila acididurans]|uniref:Helix-turn-helix domain-containing protein n=1 Tax=Actinacidiphila acididurans TaxID=2784346 RepID=A0ABS2U5Q3_9ACTN|nr:hypothetical protein [Actinacidiphila acididurans]MBM9510056.1 hypothetical protein [Actinacidiphila acididurans]